jgi:hypothetical protein
MPYQEIAQVISMLDVLSESTYAQEPAPKTVLKMAIETLKKLTQNNQFNNNLIPQDCTFEIDTELVIQKTNVAKSLNWWKENSQILLFNRQPQEQNPEKS